MLCEMIQSQKKYYTISLFEVFSQMHKAENKMVVVLPGMGGVTDTFRVENSANL